MTDPELIDTIRDVLNQFGGLGADAHLIGLEADLFASGMTSYASVSVMLALEDTLAITFPESMLRRSTFQTIDALAGSIAKLRADVTE